MNEKKLGPLLEARAKMAATKVAGLEAEMSPENNEDQHKRMAMHQVKEADKDAVEAAVVRGKGRGLPRGQIRTESELSVGGAVASLLPSSASVVRGRGLYRGQARTESGSSVGSLQPSAVSALGRGQVRTESESSGKTPVAFLHTSPASVRGRGVTRGQTRTEVESSSNEGGYESVKSEGEGTPQGNIAGNMRGVNGSRRIASLCQSDKVDRKSDDESVKTFEMSKQGVFNVNTVVVEVGNEESRTDPGGPSSTIVTVRKNSPGDQQAAVKVTVTVQQNPLRGQQAAARERVSPDTNSMIVLLSHLMTGMLFGKYL